MLETILEISFLSDWHVSSGLGDGAIADSILNRDINGIPVIPGSAIKGALREGAWRLALCDRDKLGWLVDYVFGTACHADVSNHSGIITVGQGQLPDSLCDWLVANPDQRADIVTDMTIIRQHTALDSHKMVVPHSLRSIECGIPGLVFMAPLNLLLPEGAEQWFTDWLGAVCACVKSLGADRARGMGRCKISPHCAPDIKLPGEQPEAVKTIRESREKK